MANDNLDKAVTDALDEEKEGQKEELDNKEGDKKEEKKVEDKEEEHFELDATKDELTNALALMRALENENTREGVLRQLAQKTGYDVTKPAAAKTLERDAKAILKEKLGDNYDLLSGDGLAQAFEELVEAKVKLLTKPVLDKFTEAVTAENSRKADTAMNSFFERHKITDAKTKEDISGKMMEKFKVMPASPNSEINSYLDDIYLLVNKGNSEARTVVKAVKKITDNAKERNSSGESTGNDDRIKTGSHTPTLDEAVRMAFDGKRIDQ